MTASALTSADTIDRHLGTRLRQLRQQHKISLQACGEILGVTYQQVQKYETGVNRLSVASLIHLARSFSIAPASFYDGLDASSLSSASDTLVPSPEDGYRFPDLQLTRSITRLSPLSRHLLHELVLAIEQSQTRRA